MRLDLKIFLLTDKAKFHTQIYMLLIFLKLQALILKRYPAQLSLTAWMSFVGAAQSAVFTVIVEHKRAAWTIGFNIDFWSTVYGVSKLNQQ